MEGGWPNLYVLAFCMVVVVGEGLQINVQYLYPFRVVVEEDLQIYVQYLYPIWKAIWITLQNSVRPMFLEFL